MFARLRQRFVDWLLADVHLRGVRFGEHSIAVSPPAVGDILRWNPAAGPAPVASGDIGMRADGRPNIFVSGAAHPCNDPPISFYTPTTPGNWSTAPTSVQQALDSAASPGGTLATGFHRLFLVMGG
jgi:hypothetical protein